MAPFDLLWCSWASRTSLYSPRCRNHLPYGTGKRECDLSLHHLEKVMRYGPITRRGILHGERSHFLTVCKATNTQTAISESGFGLIFSMVLLKLLQTLIFLWWWLTATEISQIIFKPSFSAFTIYAGTDKSKTSFPLIVNLLQGWTCKALENTMSALENTLVPIAEDIHLVRVRPSNIFDNIAAWTHNLSSVSIPLVCSSSAGLMVHTDAYYPQLQQPLSLFVYIQSRVHSTG